MILANMGLVVNMAQRYADRGDLLDDLIQEGTWGLIRAVDAFNPQKHNTRFSTYAAHWIRKGIFLALKANGAINHVAGNVLRQTRLTGAPSTIELGRLPLHPSAASNCCSDREIEWPERVTELQDAVDRLSAVESLLVRYRFGLDCPPVSVAIMSRQLGISKRRVCDLERAALAKLRAMLDPEILN
jgi:RNA polymerase sigma factor (sigma-70 family)